MRADGTASRKIRAAVTAAPLLNAQIAGHIGEKGDAPEALRLFQALFRDQVEHLGPRHPDTLNTRISIAHYTGETGRPDEARRLFQALLPERIEVLGVNHPDTENTRRGVADWTERTTD